jgi:hypothetical protein
MPAKPAKPANPIKSGKLPPSDFSVNPTDCEVTSPFSVSSTISEPSHQFLRLLDRVLLGKFFLSAILTSEFVPLFPEFRNSFGNWDLRPRFRHGSTCETHQLLLLLSRQ